MRKSEVMINNYDAIIDEMRNCYRTVAEYPNIKEDIYIWEDGEIETMEDILGGNTWLKPKEYETRKLYFVMTISLGVGFDHFDLTDHSAPEDEDEREKEKLWIIHWMMEDYDPESILDDLINEAENEEKYDTMY